MDHTALCLGYRLQEPERPGRFHPDRAIELGVPEGHLFGKLQAGETITTPSGVEVTPEQEIVWEYMSPYTGRSLKTNLVYRSYRLPYDWVPQASRPVEKAVARLDNNKFRVPGSVQKRPQKVTPLKH